MDETIYWMANIIHSHPVWLAKKYHSHPVFLSQFPHLLLQFFFALQFSEVTTELQNLSRPKPDTRICDHDRHANIKPIRDINKNQLNFLQNFYGSFSLSLHSYFFT